MEYFREVIAPKVISNIRAKRGPFIFSAQKHADFDLTETMHLDVQTIISELILPLLNQGQVRYERLFVYSDFGQYIGITSLGDLKR